MACGVKCYMIEELVFWGGGWGGGGGGGRGGVVCFFIFGWGGGGFMNWFPFLWRPKDGGGGCGEFDVGACGRMLRLLLLLPADGSERKEKREKRRKGTADTHAPETFVSSLIGRRNSPGGKKKRKQKRGGPAGANKPGERGGIPAWRAVRAHLQHPSFDEEEGGRSNIKKRRGGISPDGQ